MCSMTVSVLASRLTPGLVLRISELAATRIVPAAGAARLEERRAATSAAQAPGSIRFMATSMACGRPSGGELVDGTRRGLGGDGVLGEIDALVRLARDPHLAELGVDHRHAHRGGDRVGDRRLVRA